MVFTPLSRSSSNAPSTPRAVGQPDTSSSFALQMQKVETPTGRQESAEAAIPSSANHAAGIDVDLNNDAAALRCEGGRSCTPCHFVNAAKGCKLGEACAFCHVHVFASRMRPSKAKRAKAKRLADGLETQLQPEELTSVTSGMGNRRPYFLSIMRGKARQMKQDATLLQQQLEPYYPK